MTSLTTLHTGQMVDSGKTNGIFYYNINMRLVDKSNMMISGVECVRKTVKWYKKLFFNLVDVCLPNVHIYDKQHTDKRLPLQVFVHGLVYQLLEKYGTVTRVSPGRAVIVLQLPDLLLGKDYISRHHIVSISLGSDTQRGQRTSAQRQFVVCFKTTRRQRTTKRTSLMC